MKYAVIKAHEGKLRARMMCGALEVSSSGYYDWRGRRPSARARARDALDEQVKEAFVRENAGLERHA